MDNKIQLLIDKLSEFFKLSDAQKVEFSQNILGGFSIRIFAEGKNIVSPEIFEKLKAILNTESPDPEEAKLTIDAYLKEMNESDEGKLKIEAVINELFEEAIDQVKDRLTPTQKSELLEILE